MEIMERIHELITVARLDLKELQDELRKGRLAVAEYPKFAGVTTLEYHQWLDQKKYLESEVDRLMLQIRRKEEEIRGLQAQNQTDLFPTVKMK
jgi:hypothetical protein